MTKLYTFDCTLRAAFTVEAESEEEARRIVEPFLDCGTAHIVEFADEDPAVDDVIVAEVSLDGGLDLSMIDGEDVSAKTGI